MTPEFLRQFSQLSLLKWEYVALNFVDHEQYMQDNSFYWNLLYCKVICSKSSFRENSFFFWWIYRRSKQKLNQYRCLIANGKHLYPCWIHFHILIISLILFEARAFLKHLKSILNSYIDNPLTCLLAFLTMLCSFCADVHCKKNGLRYREQKVSFMHQNCHRQSLHNYFCYISHPQNLNVS